MRYQDEQFDTTRFFKMRLVAEDDGVIVGSAEASHRPSRFDPGSYEFRVWVVPERRRRWGGAAMSAAAVSWSPERCGRAGRGATKVCMAGESGRPPERR